MQAQLLNKSVPKVVLIQPNLNEQQDFSKLSNTLKFLIIILGDVIGATLLKETPAVVWFCLVCCKFENCEVYFDLYRGDINVHAVAKLNFVHVSSSGFSLLKFLKIGCFKCCPYPAISLFRSSKLVGCSEPLEGVLIHTAYLAPLLSLF